jgi:dihydrofolate reductase
MRSILAVNNLGYIGKENKIMWRSSDDFAHFKKMTMGSTLLVGYKTASELPPLKGRTVIVDDRTHYSGERGDDHIWCIGGKKTYEKYAEFFTELHISHIDDDSIGDVMMPDFRNLNPNCKIFHYYFDTNDKKLDFGIPFVPKINPWVGAQGTNCD